MIDELLIHIANAAFIALALGFLVGYCIVSPLPALLFPMGLIAVTLPFSIDGIIRSVKKLKRKEE